MALALTLKVAVNAIALWICTLVISGIQLGGASQSARIGTLIVVALIFGVVNAVIKPIVKTVGCAFYLLTLGLIGLVVNGLLLWLTSWVAGKLSLPFHIAGFWAAFWGAIIVAIVGWLLGILIPERDRGQPE
jgi:putative membrane protein